MNGVMAKMNEMVSSERTNIRAAEERASKKKELEYAEKYDCMLAVRR